MYDEIKKSFAESGDAIPPPKTFRHKVAFGDKMMLKDFLCKLRNGSMTSVD